MCVNKGIRNIKRFRSELFKYYVNSDFYGCYLVLNVLVCKYNYVTCLEIKQYVDIREGLDV